MKLLQAGCLSDRDDGEWGRPSVGALGSSSYSGRGIAPRSLQRQPESQRWRRSNSGPSTLQPSGNNSCRASGVSPGGSGIEEGSRSGSMLAANSRGPLDPPRCLRILAVGLLHRIAVAADQLRLLQARCLRAQVSDSVSLD